MLTKHPILCCVWLACSAAAAASAADCVPNLTLDPGSTVLDRSSLIPIRYECAADAAQHTLLIDGLPVARRLAGIAEGRLNFQVIDASTDASEAKTLAEAWRSLAARPQPVEVTLALKPPDAAKPAVMAGKMKLYAQPAVISCAVAGEQRRPCSPIAKGDLVQLRVANLPLLRTNAGAEPLFLMLDGRPAGLPDEEAAGLPAAGPQDLRFLLTADGTTDQAAKLLPTWRSVMAANGYDDLTYRLGVGTASQVLTAPPGVAVRIKRVDGFWAKLWFSFVVAVLAGLFYLGSESELLRESCPPPAAGRRAFSLAKVQMAFWFALILIAVVLYRVVLGEELAIPSNLLALMGISGGTYVLARLVDDAKDDRGAAVTSDGFVRDLLTSVNGVELHRFQIVVWTLVFGLMMIREFALTLVLPDPNAAALTLMGMSSGVYLSLKVPEKKS